MFFEDVKRLIVINLYFRDLSENLTTDKIAEIRAKLISNRRTRIKPEDEDSKSQSLALGDMEVTTIKLYFFNLLWGSEIGTCRIWNGHKDVGLQMVWISYQI